MRDGDAFRENLIKGNDTIDLPTLVKFFKIQIKGLKYLLSCKFHVFWSNVKYRTAEKVIRCVDSFLQFCSRPHDFLEFFTVTSEKDKEFL